MGLVLTLFFFFVFFFLSLSLLFSQNPLVFPHLLHPLFLTKSGGWNSGGKLTLTATILLSTPPSEMDCEWRQLAVFCFVFERDGHSGGCGGAQRQATLRESQTTRGLVCLSFFFTTQYPFLLHHDYPNVQQSWQLCVCVCVFVCVGEFVAGLFFAGGVEGVEQLFGCCGWCKLVSFAWSSNGPSPAKWPDPM